MPTSHHYTCSFDSHNICSQIATMRVSVAIFIINSLLLADITGAARVQIRQSAITITETATTVAATPTAWTWNSGASNAWPIHESCNATERAQLKRGLDEAATLAQHARDHILRFGNSSEFYQKYFGNAPTGEVIGWYAASPTCVCFS